MPPKSPFDIAALAVRMALGAVFLYSAGKKFVEGGAHGFAADIANFMVLMDPYNFVLACLLLALEAVTGICLLVGLLGRGALLAGMGMTGLFLFGIVQGWARGMDISCGCFGKSEVAVNYPLHTAGLLVLFALHVFVWRFAGRRGSGYLFGGEKMKLPGGG